MEKRKLKGNQMRSNRIFPCNSNIKIVVWYKLILALDAEAVAVAVAVAVASSAPQGGHNVPVNPPS